jgi:hypothetical protein
VAVVAVVGDDTAGGFDGFGVSCCSYSSARCKQVRLMMYLQGLDDFDLVEVRVRAKVRSSARPESLELVYYSQIAVVVVVVVASFLSS